MKTMKTYVIIKTWVDMETEFGLLEDRNIDVQFQFTPDMEKKLPKNRCIEVEPSSTYEDQYNWDEEDYSISRDMIERWVDPVKDSMYFV